MEKNKVRQLIRRNRAALSSDQVAKASQQVLRKFVALDIVRHAKRIAVYIADDNEIDTSPLIEWLGFQEKKIFLPMMVEQGLVFYTYRQHHLVKNKFNILEPNPLTCSVIDISKLDIIVVPMVAFDNQLARIGRGAGYYDRALANLDQYEARPMLVGLAYHMQRIDDCKPHARDVKMDFIITP